MFKIVIVVLCILLFIGMVALDVFVSRYPDAPVKKNKKKDEDKD